MSLALQPPPPIPEATARVARAAFPRGNRYLTLRDTLGPLFCDKDFAALFSHRGQPAYPPWRLALVTVMQFMEQLSDRQAADAVRARLDWKYLLALELTDPGFDPSVLSEFRRRLLQGGAETLLLDRLLERLREEGLIRDRGRQRTDSTHVVAALRELTRLELLGETLRAALGELARRAPAWVQTVAQPSWFEHYGPRVEERRLPRSESTRAAYARVFGLDGFKLLDAIDERDDLAVLRELPAVAVLRTVWQQHYERERPGQVPRMVDHQGHGAEEPIESPYEHEARYRRKRDVEWTGYTVHVTETCDEERPRLLVHVDTTPANVHEERRTQAISEALAAKGLTPREHLVDAAYVDAGHLEGEARERGTRLVGPPRRDKSWQGRTEGAYDQRQFQIDWEREEVTCPEGKRSAGWNAYRDAKRGRYLSVRFSTTDCGACPSRARCTKGKSRSLVLHPQPEHEALEAARVFMESEEGRGLYAQRAGVEAVFSQGVRAYGMRQSRYRGLQKTHLQQLATAAAIDLVRVGQWMAGQRPAATRRSAFEHLAA